MSVSAAGRASCRSAARHTCPSGGCRLRTVAKPWGRELWWAETERYVGKRLELAAGHATSLQLHRRKCETLYFLSGRLRLTVAGESFEVGPGEALTIPPGTVHRLEALTDVVVFEVSTPEVDDVVRLEDRYGRAGA